jgi:hypothetical protein
VQIVASKQKSLIRFRWKAVSTGLPPLSSTTEQDGKPICTRDLSDLILQLEERPGSLASETVQTPENTGDLPGREGSTGKLFAPDERVLTDPHQRASRCGRIVSNPETEIVKTLR